MTTHNTREGIDEKKYPSHKELDMDKYRRFVEAGNFDGMFNYGFDVGKDTLHQELQKAREDSKGEPANKAVLLKALKTIGWDMRGNYPNERIVDHNGKSTCYRVLTDGVQVLGVSENSAADFYFKTAKVRVLDSGNAVSLGTDDCFILFMNHSISDKTITKDHSELDHLTSVTGE